MEVTHVDEEAYLFELVAYRVQFLEYRYDRLSSKLIENEGGVGVSQIPTSVELIPASIGIQSELVVIITKVPTQMQGGSDFTIIPYTLPLNYQKYMLMHLP